MPATSLPITRRNRQTRTQVRMDAFGRDSFRLTCLDHGSQRVEASRRQADLSARVPAEWCAACATMVAQPNREMRRTPAAPAPRRGRRLGLDRRFGVEIEFTGIDRYTVHRWLTANMSGWRVISDISCGLEIVSPPLRGQDGMDDIRKVLRWMRDNGAQVNTRCGLHVHHDVSDMTADQVKAFVKSYAHNQPLMNLLVAPSRRSGNTYCQPLHADEVAALDRHSDVRSAASAVSSRYRTINIHAYGRHGTIEIRQHQGTLNFTKVETWIKLGQALADEVVESGGEVVSKSGLRSLLRDIKTDDETSAFLLGRAIQFGADANLVAA